MQVREFWVLMNHHPSRLSLLQTGSCQGLAASRLIISAYHFIGHRGSTRFRDRPCRCTLSRTGSIISTLGNGCVQSQRSIVVHYGKEQGAVGICPGDTEVHFYPAETIPYLSHHQWVQPPHTAASDSTGRWLSLIQVCHIVSSVWVQLCDTDTQNFLWQQSCNNAEDDQANVIFKYCSSIVKAINSTVCTVIKAHSSNMSHDFDLDMAKQ